jgi:hypothetical protein
MKLWSNRVVSGVEFRVELQTQNREVGDAKGRRTENSKHKICPEQGRRIRNSKQIPNAQKLENSKPGVSDYCFEFSPVLGSFGFEFVSNFDIRTSDFIELI